MVKLSQSNVDFELYALVNGKRIREYFHDGKVFIEGKKNSEFTLKFKNNTWNKVLIVPSVDGLSVMDGKEATTNSGGYIVDPYSGFEIKGWRTSLDDVASFIFDEKKYSYAASKGENKAVNCGVIGCRIISEKPYTLTTNTWLGSTTSIFPSQWNSTLTTGTRRGSSQFIGSLGEQTSNSLGITEPTSSVRLSSDISESIFKGPSSLQSPDFSLGTGWGKEQSDKVKMSSFERDEIKGEFAIYYTDRAGLERAGIDLSTANEINVFPSAFNDTFCKPPKS